MRRLMTVVVVAVWFGHRRSSSITVSISSIGGRISKIRASRNKMTIISNNSSLVPNIIAVGVVVVLAVVVVVVVVVHSL